MKKFKETIKRDGDIKMTKKNLDSKDKRRMHSSLLYKSMMEAIEVFINSKKNEDIFKMNLLSFSHLTNIDESENNTDSISLGQEIFKVESFKVQSIYNELDKYQIFIRSKLESNKSYITKGGYERDLKFLLDYSNKYKQGKEIELKQERIKAEQLRKAIEQFKETGEQPEIVMQPEESKHIPEEPEILYPIFLKIKKIEALENAEKKIRICRKLVKGKKYKKAMICALDIASFIIAMQQSDLLPTAMTGKKFIRTPNKLRAEARSKAIKRKKELMDKNKKNLSARDANTIVKNEFDSEINNQFTPYLAIVENFKSDDWKKFLQ